jgi:hypothetical protein
LSQKLGGLSSLSKSRMHFHINGVGNIVMSNREKGLPTTIEKTIPNVMQAYYCQHIVDNIQHRFSIKYKPLF